MIEENYEKNSIMLVGTGIWTRDLPNASLVRYHGATSLGHKCYTPVNKAMSEISSCCHDFYSTFVLGYLHGV